MRTLLTLLLIGFASPVSAAECQTFIAPADSRYAGDQLRFTPDGHIIYNGEITPKAYATRCSDEVSICIYVGQSIILATRKSGNLHYFTLFEGGLPTETLPWHSVIEPCTGGLPT